MVAIVHMIWCWLKERAEAEYGEEYLELTLAKSSWECEREQRRREAAAEEERQAEEDLTRVLQQSELEGKTLDERRRRDGEEQAEAELALAMEASALDEKADCPMCGQAMLVSYIYDHIGSGCESHHI